VVATVATAFTVIAAVAFSQGGGWADERRSRAASVGWQVLHWPASSLTRDGSVPACGDAERPRAVMLSARMGVLLISALMLRYFFSANALRRR